MARYWVGGGASTNWSATGNTNWAATSGGANNASVPGGSDDVFFDANSGIDNSVLDATTSIQSIDCTNYTGTLTHNTAVTLNLIGASGGPNTYLLSAGMTYTRADGTSATNFGAGGGNSFNITTNTHILGQTTINGIGSVNTFVDDFHSGTLTMQNGTFDAQTNNINVTCSTFISIAGTRTIKWGDTSVLSLTNPGAGGVLLNLSSTSLTWVNGSNLTVTATGVLNGSTRRTFTMSGETIGTVNLVNIGTNAIFFSSSGGTIGTFNASNSSGAVNIQFAPNSTYTFTVFNVRGRPAVLAGITSGTAGTAYTFTMSAGTVSCDYLSLKDSTATGGAAWYAGANSTNVSGNSGWIFAGAPVQFLRKQYISSQAINRLALY